MPHDPECQCSSCTDADAGETNEFDFAVYDLDELGVDGLVDVLASAFGEL